VIDDMAIGDPVPCGPALARLGLVPRHPYSAVPFEVIGKCGEISPNAMQQSLGQMVGPGRKLGPRSYSLGKIDGSGGNFHHICRLAVHAI
jgi:hypothetical protein